MGEAVISVARDLALPAGMCSAGVLGAQLLWLGLRGVLLLCLLQGASAQGVTGQDECPAFPAGDTVVETAAGCEHSVEILFTMKSSVASATQIAILDVSDRRLCLARPLQCVRL